jgi:putative heme-binding domain-containing protein
MRGREITDELLVHELENPNRSVEAHATALALLNPNSKFLSTDRMRKYLQSDYSPLRVEAVRSLAQQTNGQRFELLAEVAQDEVHLDDVRAEALVGLSAAADKYQDVLQKLATSDHFVVRREAERALRLAGLKSTTAEPKPLADELDAWKKILDVPGNAVAGRRLFFSPVGARCSVCHTYAGRGGKVGPDLTQIGGSTSRERIITSILHPSQEIAPDYQPWVLVTADGKSYTGLRTPRGGDNRVENFIDSDGKQFTLKSEEIKDRQAAAKSLMPDNLHATLTIDDLRDLVTFLSSSAK